MNVYSLVPLISVLAYLALTGLVLRYPQRRAHREFALYLFSAMLWSFSSFMLHADFFPERAYFWNGFLIVVLVWMTVNYYHFVRAFVGKSPGALVVLSYIFLFFFSITMAQGDILKSAYVEDGILYHELGLWLQGIALITLALAGGALALLHQYYRSLQDPISRTRVVYLLLALATVLLFSSSNLVPSLGKFPVDHAGNLLSALLISYAILKHQLMEINVVIRRGLVYVIRGFVGLSAYTLTLFILHLAFDVNISTIILIAVAGGLIPILAVLSQPIWQRSQEAVERLFFRDTYDYRRLLTTFTSRMGDVLNLEELARNMLYPLTRALRSSRACLLLPNTEGDYVLRFADPPELQDSLAEISFAQDSPIVEWLTKEGRVLTQETIELRPEFKSLWKAEEEYLESLDAAFLCPLRSKGKLIGILGVGKKSTDSYYDQDDVDLLMTMATEAAITIENARVLEELRKEQLRAEELLDLTVQAQEDERKRVSVELHDSVAQWLVSASYRIQVCQALLSQPGNSATAEELSDIDKIIHNSIQELRAIMVGLHPPNLEELGFVPALRRTVEQLNQNGLVGKFHIEGDPERLPPHMELAIYRIVQESITNIRKHASATTVNVWLQPKQDQVSLEIRDNGKGFIQPRSWEGP